MQANFDYYQVSYDHSLLDLKSAVQDMKHFIYHFTLIIMLSNTKFTALEIKYHSDSEASDRMAFIVD